MSTVRGSLCRRLARPGWAIGLPGLALILLAGPLQAAEAPPARLVVSVAAADGSPLTAPYVAVVPEAAPWSRPAREAVLEGEPSVSWELPPGRYRIAAGAPGFALERQPVIELAPNAEASRRITLVALVPVAGRVVDEEGRPLAGAAVSHAHRLIHGFSGTLSPLGESHLAGNSVAVSDEDGGFRIPLHAEAGSFLGVEAPGRAPRFYPNLRLPGAAATLQEVTLLRGASLAVRWPPGAGSAGPWDRLQLVPTDGVYPAGLDLGGVLAFWARPVAGGSQAWSSLPAGRYEVWLKAPPSGPHSVAPVRLGEVALRRGAAEEVTVEMPRARGERHAADGGEPTAGPFEILLPAIPGAELDSLIVLGPAGPEPGRDATWSTESVSGGVLVRVEEGCREGARFLLATPSRVAGVGPVEAEACGEAIRAELHPRSDLALGLRPPEGTALADLAAAGGRIDLRSCAGPAPPTVAQEIPLPALENGRIETPIPAGCLDLAVRLGDFAPLTWAGVEARPGEVLDLGTRRLRPGAALLVRVVSPLDRLPLEGVQVGVATPEVLESWLRGGAADRLTESPGGAGDTAAVTDPHGWTRLYGLPTGEDLVPLLLGPGRKVPVPTDPVMLSPGEELVLEALELPPPAALTVEVELSAALEEREAEPYQVHLGPVDPRAARPSVVRPVDADGRARFEEVLPGSYRLMGIVRLGSGRSFPAGTREVEVGPAMDETVTLELADSLYGGRVTYQGEPVAGSMALMPVEHRIGARGITVRLDEDGRYQALLEGPGLYSVRVTDDQDRRFAFATVPEVEFRNPDLPVDIELPGANLHGQVIDEDGKPVPEARVDLTSRRSSAAVEGVQNLHRFWRADEAGRFVIEALEPGSWTVVASAGERESWPQTLDVPRDARVDGLRLVIEEGGTLSGQVVNDLGHPVSGARLWISVQPETIGEVLPPIQAVADAEGRFQVQGRFEGRPANVEVSTPDGLSAAFRAELTGGLRLDLPPAGGPLEVRLPCDGPGAGTARFLALVSEQGAFLSLVRHASAARETGDAACRVLWTVPRLGAGAWRLVEVAGAPEAAALEAGGGGLLPALADVSSRPGEAQRVTLPGASSSPADPAGARDQTTSQNGRRR